MRGVVGEELDDAVVRDIGAALARLLARRTRRRRPSSSATTCATARPTLAAAFAEGVTGAGPRRRLHRPGQHRHALLRLRHPRHAGRDVHREPQPGPLQRHQALPRRRHADRPGHRPREHPRGRRAGRARRGRAAAASPSATSSPTTPTTCAAWSTSRRIRPLKVVVDAGNGMGGYTVPAVLGGDLPLDVVPLYFELDGSFPNHEANPLDPANLVDLQKRVVVEGADLGPGLRRRRRPLLRRRRARRAGEPERDHRAGRRPRAGQGAGQRRHPQPDHLAGRAGDRRRARRTAGAHPRRALVHQADDGRDRRRVRRRALRALLLPRLLARRLRHARRPARARRARRRRTRTLSAAHGRLTTATPRPARSTRRSPTRPRPRPPCARRSPTARTFDELDGLTVALRDGSGSTCAPSNTEPLLRLNVEAADATAMAALRDEVLAIVRA